jgi:hypothetical protein
MESHETFERRNEALPIVARNDDLSFAFLILVQVAVSPFLRRVDRGLI